VYSSDDVLVEEAKGALVRRGGEADEEGIEVVEHQLPQVVDGAVALVDDDEIESLDGRAGVVVHHLGLALRLSQLVQRHILGRVVDGLTGEDGIQPLDGGDAHLGVRVDVGRGQALHVVQLGELAPVVGRRVGHELLMRLLAEIAGILPAPVAMWIRARGLLRAREFSSPVTALTWQSRRFCSGSAGMFFAMRARRVSGWAAHSANCSGR